MISAALAAYYQLRSAKFRKPGVSWITAAAFLSVLFGDPFYTEEAWPYRKKCMLWLLGFVVSFISAFIISSLTGVTH
ncbi:MAG: hypothetical protein GY762_07695 [Proteobacteria bacterium]|nr:hypothetical protein [Pseudomonadota bacterium]